MKGIHFVTGATGLVGSHLIFRLLSEGEHVIAAVRKTSNRELLKKVFSYYCDDPEGLFRMIEWLECDLSDFRSVKEAIPGGSMVYHCAAMVSFAGSDSRTVIENNVLVTANIVRACLEKRVLKLCHVSSTAAIGAGESETKVNEAHQWDDSEDHSPYSVSKHLSELEVWKGIEAGLNIVIVNPSVIIGPGEWNRSSSQFFPSIDGGMLFYTFGITGYVYVADVVESMLLLMRSQVSGERYLVTAENLTYKEFFDMIATALGVRKPSVYAPRYLAYAGVAAAAIVSRIRGKQSPLSTDTLKSAYSVVKFDNSKIKETIGIQFMPVSEAVKTVAAIYKKEKNRK